MSVLALFLLYSVKTQFFNSNYIILLLGVFYMIFGNYFKTIKANYFLGIRTPWNLENEIVWKETHKFGGKMWLVGGILIVMSSLIFKHSTQFYNIHNYYRNNCNYPSCLFIF